ncbi:BC040823 protein, putative [Brugia malayi]|uniref:BC040823 protein, putative n=1 Tax=Brugia malayi TaxID=6279 RepID=A0A0J9XZX3_BRUMA|nr:BC040823 protein, putative [Brugia malayi]CDP99421.1 BMA-CAR-1, isoform d [Brugia malayi]VIO99868.1 BC040823 protein, putative [Brugia malayi]
MAQQTPYIGSRISLISKLDIRYEGILYTVDTNESTIALAKVRSFGTEDRPTPNPVAARDDIYEYIIFKATDIKDLIVCETPKPVPQLASGLAYDPAILSISSGRTIPMHPSVPGVPMGSNIISAGSSRSGTPNRISPAEDPAHSRAPGAGRNQRTGSLPSAVQPTTGQQNYPNVGGTYQGSYGRGGQQNNYRESRGGFFTRGGSVNYQRGGGGHRGGVGGKPQSKEKLKFESDYDFEKANEQFQETLNHISLDLKKTKLEDGSKKSGTGSDAGSDVIEEEVTENGQEEQEKRYYDKSSSFFDRISCEALEKQEGKPRTDWRKERETNQETFGHSAVRSLTYRRPRGFMSGRGGRSGHMNSAYRYSSGYNYGNQQRSSYGNFHNNYNRRNNYRSNASYSGQ